MVFFLFSFETFFTCSPRTRAISTSCSLQQGTADACVAGSGLTWKRITHCFCGSCFATKHLGDFNKNNKLENPQDWHVKQERIPIVPVLQVGKLRHRPLKFQQSSKMEMETLKKTRTVVYKENPSHTARIFPSGESCLSRSAPVTSGVFSKPDFSGPLCERSF